MEMPQSQSCKRKREMEWHLQRQGGPSASQKAKEKPLLSSEPGTILVLVFIKHKDSFCLVQEQRCLSCRGPKHRQGSFSIMCCSSAGTAALYEQNMFSSFSKKHKALEAAEWILLCFHFKIIVYWGILNIIFKTDFSFPACRRFHFPAAGKHR